MDPLTALGLAGNIVTFIDFSQKLLSKTQDVYRAADGFSTNQRALSNELRDYIFLAGTISPSQNDRNRQLTVNLNETALDNTVSALVGHSTILAVSAQGIGVSGEAESSIYQIAKSCGDVAGQMLRRLEAMRRKDGRVWSSLKAALQELWGLAELEEMARRLETFKSQLQLSVVMSLRQNLDLMSSRQEDQFESMRSSMRESIQQIIQQNMLPGPMSKTTPSIQKLQSTDLTPGTIAQLGEQHEVTRREVIRAVRQALAERDLEPLDFSTLSRPEAITKEAKEYSSKLLAVEKELLDSLMFPVMLDREENISEAERATFDWIFENPRTEDLPWDNFSQWLGSADSLYWITGKAGSGKSTLMKHLFCHDKTRAVLRQWSKKFPLVVAGFFFWNTGSYMQKTQEGLLRSLIYQVLSLHRELIPVVVKSRSDSRDRREGFIWTSSRLKQVFDQLIQQTTVPVKICFFIDGLDEYGGNHAEISELLKRVSLVDNVKVCVSSRPLVVFERAYNAVPRLMLQNLTYRDIKVYVVNKFNQSPEMCQLQEEDPELARRLSSEIVNKALGVFIWVRLVVDSLIQGLSSYDRGADLERRLRELPEDLMQLYLHMLTNVRPAFYREQGIKYLLIVFRAVKPFSLLQFTFTDMENPNLALKVPFKCLSPEERLSQCTAMEGRLKTRCLGLIEVATSSAATGASGAGYTGRSVRFMHQSVADFLRTSEVQILIAESLKGGNFSPFPSLMQASLLELKHLDTKLLPHRQPAMVFAQLWFQTSWEIIRKFCTYAGHEEMETESTMMELVDELDRVAMRLSKSYVAAEWRHNLSVDVHWTERRREGQKPLAIQLHGTMISFALEFGLYQYVREALGLDKTSTAHVRKMTKAQTKYALMVEELANETREGGESKHRRAVREGLGRASKSRLEGVSDKIKTGLGLGLGRGLKSGTEELARLITKAHRYEAIVEDVPVAGAAPPTQEERLISKTVFTSVVD